MEEIIEHVKKIESILYDKWQRQELTNLIESLYYAGHVDWLIEQAKEKIQLEERVKELEQEKAEKVEYWRKQHRKRANELDDAYFRIQLIEIQNQHYREALEEIRCLYPLRNVGYQVSEIKKIVVQALEVTEK